MEDVMDQIPTASDRAALLIAVPSALLAFWIGFNLGAFDDIFFDQVLAVWVVATIVLVASLVSNLPPRGWPGRLVLLVPTVWLIVATLIDPGGRSGSTDVLFIITVVVTVVTLPFIGWILVTAINPDFLGLPRANRNAVIAAALVFFLAGWVLGTANDQFLTCDDFKVSGNDLPAGCTPGPGSQ
jgi:F0F1-type ATP synthase membrane subunit a